MLDIRDYTMLFLVWFITIPLMRALLRSEASKTTPGPQLALPFIGHLHLLYSPLHQALFKLSSRSKHCVVASFPKMAKEILKANEESCLNHSMLIASEHLTYGAADYIFTPYGSYWRFMKKICMTKLLSGRTLEQFVSIREEEIEVFLRSILQGTYTDKPIQIREELIKLTNNIISRMTMGKKCSRTNDEVGEMRKVIQEVGALLTTFNLGDYIGFLKPLDLQGIGKKVKEVHHKLDTMMEEVIKEHQVARLEMSAHGDRRKDIIDLSLDLMEVENSKMKFSRESAKAFALEMFVGGTNSSASVIEWTLVELIKNPHIFVRARKEIDCVVGKNSVEATAHEQATSHSITPSHVKQQKQTSDISMQR